MSEKQMTMGVLESQGICECRVEDHVAANLSTVASAFYEATTRYAGWNMHWHGPAGGGN